jgi:Sulfatase-modifying factor enzyme 1
VVALNQLNETTLIRGGTFRMGPEDFYPEESPVQEVEVGDFWMDGLAIPSRQAGDTRATSSPRPAAFSGFAG